MENRIGRMYGVDEIAKMLNVSETLIYKLVRKGEIKSLKIGSVWRVSANSLENFLNGNTGEQSEKIKNRRQPMVKTKTYLPHDLHELLKNQAKKEGKKVSCFIRETLQEKLLGETVKKGKLF